MLAIAGGPEATAVAPERACRADERIRAAALATLRASGYRPLGCLCCEVRDGAIIVSGVVPSFYLKQVAQAVLLRLGHVREVRNLVEVCRPFGRERMSGHDADRAENADG
jgi:hypothetical protein